MYVLLISEEISVNQGYAFIIGKELKNLPVEQKYSGKLRRTSY